MKVTLEDLAGPTGIFTDGDWVETKDQDPMGNVRLVQLADIGDGNFINKSSRYMNSAKASELRCTYLKPGDILIARMPDPIGRACIFPGRGQPSVTVVDVCILRPDLRRVYPRWLLHKINGEEFRRAIHFWITGTTRQRISRGNLSRIEFTLPSLDEQRRNAAILDKADALRRKRKHGLDLLDSLTQSIFLEIFGNPVGSTHHKIEPMGDVIREIESGWSPTCLDRASIDGEPGVLKLSAITGSEFNPEENKALPPGLRPKAGTEVVVGDILFCRKNTRELVGSSVYVWNTRPNLHMSDLIFKLVPDKNKIDPIFLQTQLSLPSLRHRISEMSGGAAGSMPNVSKARLRDLEIIVPRLEKQAEFARVVRGHFALRGSQVTSQTQIDFLFYSLQSRAFSGQL